MRLSLRATSTRTFVALPLALGVEQAVRRAPVHPVGAPLLAAGFAAYRLAGNYRIRRAGGPPGFSQGMPERLVTDGVYGWTRNPMYLGHMTFMTGAALVTRSPIAILALALGGPWFGRRVAADEARLSAAFGTEYDAYAARVPRWLPGRPTAR
ncbi:MAG: isoprenylcysteine carboxyl methyltransferase [Blastococcus sp.]|jgi:protein-S-isoprenylcysteine O-methyltransferase Ste14|nr:isoprenylcysteine carboxyl methyltransferase [Blastococcus sp.]